VPQDKAAGGTGFLVQHSQIPATIPHYLESTAGVHSGSKFPKINGFLATEGKISVEATLATGRLPLE
jgi:hypothetical protein